MADFGFKGASLINIKENQCTHIILECELMAFILELRPLLISNPILKAYCIAIN